MDWTTPPSPRMLASRLDDDLRSARGVVNGLLVSATLWLAGFNVALAYALA